jgi:hypothetical protein
MQKAINIEMSKKWFYDRARAIMRPLYQSALCAMQISTLYGRSNYLSLQNVHRIMNIWENSLKTCIYVPTRKMLLLVYYNYTSIRKTT